MKHIEVVEKFLGERTRRPDITFYRNGRIDITASVAERLSLRAGDVIDIARGKEEYYLYVRLRRADGAVGRHEAQCYPSKSGTRNFRAYSKKICSSILGISGGNTARIMAGGDIESDNLGKTVVLIPQFNLDRQSNKS